MLWRLKMFMPSNPQDTNNLASVEAYNAALEVQTGVAEFVFQQLCEHSTLISEILADIVRQSDVVYAGNASSLSRSSEMRGGGKQMRMNGGKPLIAKKMGSPVEGRLSSKDTFPASSAFLPRDHRNLLVGY